MTSRYELRLHGPARRMLEHKLPTPAAFAILTFCHEALCENPRRAGHPLQGELAGHHSARRGAYRIVYRIDDDTGVVHVVRIDHRADVYRPR